MQFDLVYEVLVDVFNEYITWICHHILIISFIEPYEVFTSVVFFYVRYVLPKKDNYDF